MYAWTLPSAPSPAQDGSWQLTVGILSHWVPAHHLPSGPHLTSCLSGFTQTHSSSHCLLMTKLLPIPGPAQELFSLPGTLFLLSSPVGLCSNGAPTGKTWSTTSVTWFPCYSPHGAQWPSWYTYFVSMYWLMTTGLMSTFPHYALGLQGSLFTREEAFIFAK